MLEVFGETTYEYHKKAVQTMLQTKKIDPLILEEYKHATVSSPTVALTTTSAAEKVIAAASQPNSTPTAAAAPAPGPAPAPAPAPSPTSTATKESAKKASTTSANTDGVVAVTKRLKTVKVEDTTSAAPNKATSRSTAGGANGDTTIKPLLVDGDFGSQSKARLQVFLNTQQQFVADTTGSSAGKKLKESGNFTSKTVKALQRFLVAFRRSLLARGEEDTGTDDPLHLKVDGKFAKGTICVLKVGDTSYTWYNTTKAVMFVLCPGCLNHSSPVNFTVRFWCLR